MFVHWLDSGKAPEKRQVIETRVVVSAALPATSWSARCLTPMNDGKLLGIKTNRHEKCTKSTVDIGNRRDMVKRSRTIKGETVVKLFRMIAVKVGRPIRARSGNSMVEFALVSPLFFLLVFGVLDYGRLFYIQETLQYAMRQAGRYAVTGQNMGGTRGAAITQVAENAAAGLINSGNINSVLITSVNSSGNTQTNNAGSSGQEMTITMVSNLKLITPGIAAFFPNGTYTFTNSVTFRNEPFAGSGL